MMSTTLCNYLHFLYSFIYCKKCGMGTQIESDKGNHYIYFNQSVITVFDSWGERPEVV